MLLLLLCAVSVASVRNFTQGTIEKNRSLDTRSALQFTPRQIDVRVGQTLHCCAVAIIPLGYDNLYFEENEYCDIIVSGTDITITGRKSTNGSDVAIKGTVTQRPIYAKNSFSISSYLLVNVI